MKKLLLSALSAMATLFCYGQNDQDSTTTGFIIYDDIRNLEDSPWRRQRPDMPTEYTTKWDLYFNPTYSHLQYHPEKEDNESSTGGMRMRMFRWEPKDRYYLDFTERSYTHYTEFMGKEFLVSDTLLPEGWKFTGKQGIVMGYPCMEMSTFEEDTVPVIAWFTPRIPVSAGPLEYVGFPGAVLYVNIGDGERTITATSIQMGRVPEEDFEKPEDGEAVGKEEYDEIVRKKTEERNRRWGR